MPVLVGLPKYRVEVGLDFVSGKKVTNNHDATVSTKNEGLTFAVDDLYQSDVTESAGMLRVKASDRNISFPLYNVLWYAMIEQKEIAE